MNIAPAGKVLSFEVTYDSSILDVAMKVYDDSGPSPVLVQGPTAMDLVVGSTYRGKFTAGNGKGYIIHKAVYTDPSFTTLHPDYAQGSESIFARTESMPTPDLEASIASAGEISGKVVNETLEGSVAALEELE